MKNTTRRICLQALGIALFTVLSLCLQVPVFENYTLCLGYAAMAVYCCSFGPAAGMAVGGLGVVLYCLVISGLRGMPGWALGNLVIGAVLGAAFRLARQMKSPWLRAFLPVGAVLLSVTAGILGVKSLTEHLLYAQPFALRAAKNLYAWAADLFVLLASLPLAEGMDSFLRKRFPQFLTE